MIYSKRIFSLIISAFIILGIIYLIILASPNLSESILNLNEYEQVKQQQFLITYIPYFWMALLIASLSLICWFGIKKKYSFLYWLVSLPIPFILIFIIGAGTATLPIDHYPLKTGESLSREMDKLQKRKNLQSEDLKIRSLSIHFRNIPLQSGLYMVARVDNPSTKLQDEYWYHPLNPISQWKKDRNATITTNETPISMSDIDWQVIPDIIAETNQRLAQKTTYYPGIKIILLLPSNDGWQWRVGINDIRDHSAGNMIYDLKGNLIGDELP